MTNVTLNKHLLVGTWHVIFYNTFKSTKRSFYKKVGKSKRIRKLAIVLHTDW